MDLLRTIRLKKYFGETRAVDERAVARSYGQRRDALVRALEARGIAARGRVCRMLRRVPAPLGEVEAAIHGTTMEKVHLHEVGALDSIIDIVGAVFALEWFAADRIVVSPINVGGGMVNSAHGVFPVPAPATVALLQGAPVYSSGIQMETLTPTGAVILTEYATAARYPGYGEIELTDARKAVALARRARREIRADLPREALRRQGARKRRATS